jgi:hypothetical protein
MGRSTHPEQERVEATSLKGIMDALARQTRSGGSE